MASNVLEFIIQLKDQFSTGLNGIGINAGKVLQDVQNKTKPVRSSLQDIQSEIAKCNTTIKISTDVSQINSAVKQLKLLESEQSRFKKRFGINNEANSSGNGGLSLMGLAKGFVGMKAVGLASSLGSTAVNASMERGAIQTQLGVLTGSEKKGNSLTNDLSKLSADTILGPGVFKNAQTLLGFGVQVENIMPLMKKLGDISGGSQEKLDSLALAFANTSSAGKLTGQDLLQYVNAGFNPLNEISRTTGKSMGQLRKEMEDGKISVQMVADSMSSATGKGGRFENMLGKVAETPFGKFQKLQGQVLELGIKFGDVLMPVISKLLDVASPVLDAIGNGLMSIQKYLSPIVHEYLGQFSKNLKIIKPIFTALADVAMPLFGHIKDFMSKTMTTIAPIAENLNKIFTSILTPAIRIVGPLLGKLFDILGWILQKVGAVVEGITWLFSKLADGIGWLLDKTANVVTQKTNVLKSIIEKGVTDNQLANMFTKVGEMHGSNYMNAMMSKMRIAASWMDRMYNTTVFTDKLNDVKATMVGGKSVVVKPTATGGGAYNFGSKENGSAEDKAKKDKDRVKSTAESITGGGAKNIYVTLGKFQDNLNIYTTTVKEGVDELEERLTNSLLRVLNSGNAIAG